MMPPRPPVKARFGHRQLGDAAGDRKATLHSRLPQEARRCACGRAFQLGDKGLRCAICRGGMDWLAALEFVGPSGRAGA
jgi:hypothetical protein